MVKDNLYIIMVNITMDNGSIINDMVKVYGLLLKVIIMSVNGVKVKFTVKEYIHQPMVLIYLILQVNVIKVLSLNF